MRLVRRSRSRSSNDRDHGAGVLVAATGNAGKLAELERLLDGLGWEVVAQSALGVEPPPEDGLTFVENAIAKARNAAERTGRPALADDSGLVVDALGGAPGIHSARYAGPDAGDAANNEKLLRALAGVPEAERTARFECAVAWLRDPRDPVPLIASGTWTGRVLEAPRGTNGFGYDPLFLDPGTGRTGAELDPGRKDALSHRGQALRELRRMLAGAAI
ncbi:MAG: RdgB/HAM1 family non-canonical purine NTP pyrophosphatase [Immundisolibacterales bacterium]|nr:RdgB/HAM1 family non-canonical purine NTP pyrophosphatase [Immundisolibacterales bacterium]